MSSIKLDITRQGISKFQIPPLYICTSRSKSLPPQQPNPNSNSHPGSDPARGLQEAPSHPTDPTSEGNPGWHAHISILSTISHRMEIGPRAFLLSDGIGSQTTSDLCILLSLSGEGGWLLVHPLQILMKSCNEPKSRGGAIVHRLLLCFNYCAPQLLCTNYLFISLHCHPLCGLTPFPNLVCLASCFAYFSFFHLILIFFHSSCI